MHRNLVIFLGLILASCAGRPASPVITYGANDEKRSCNEIYVEERNLKALALKLREEDYVRNERNLLIAYTGWLLVFIPYFFLDFSDTTDVESEAAYHRMKRLAELKQKKNCQIVK
jgi:hypothetical protein